MFSIVNNNNNNNNVYFIEFQDSMETNRIQYTNIAKIKTKRYIIHSIAGPVNHIIMNHYY